MLKDKNYQGSRQRKSKMPLWNACSVLGSLTLGDFKRGFVDGEFKALKS